MNQQGARKPNALPPPNSSRQPPDRKFALPCERVLDLVASIGPKKWHRSLEQCTVTVRLSLASTPGRLYSCLPPSRLPMGCRRGRHGPKVGSEAVNPLQPFDERFRFCDTGRKALSFFLCLFQHLPHLFLVCRCLINPEFTIAPASNPILVFIKPSSGVRQSHLCIADDFLEHRRFNAFQKASEHFQPWRCLCPTDLRIASGCRVCH